MLPRHRSQHFTSVSTRQKLALIEFLVIPFKSVSLRHTLQDFIFNVGFEVLESGLMPTLRYKKILWKLKFNYYQLRLLLYFFFTFSCMFHFKKIIYSTKVIIDIFILSQVIYNQLVRIYFKQSFSIEKYSINMLSLV